MPIELFEAIRDSRRADLRASIARILPSRDAAFVLEIGCGNGHFLTAYAAAHSERLCIGIDLRLMRVDKALRKRGSASLSNVHFLRGDVENFFHELPREARLTEIYMLFPDPWPKKRHHKNRLFRPDFLKELASRGGEGTRLFFRTDFKPYYDEAVSIASSHPCWTLLSDGPFPFEHMTIFQSRAPVFHSLTAGWKAAPAPVD